ncbi:MAG: LysE family transporter [Myxococcota bacterium]|nr:LysE family transporter [Myxococcota bacterium]MDW8360864.1 LysE family transporter [Myxococcales bacterium]
MVLAAALGIGFGFVGSIPIAGPIMALVLQRALEERFRSAVLVAIGAAVAESGYVFLAFFGFGELVASHGWIEPVSRVGGALILAVLGILLLRPRQPLAPPLLHVRPVRVRDSAPGSLGLGFAITLVNPTLLATWTAVATATHATGLLDFHPPVALAFAAGACAGIVLWSSVLVGLVWWMRGRFRAQTLDGVRRATGVVVLALAGWFVWRAVDYLRAA